MKTRSMLGLSLGVCILFAGQAALADQGNGKALGKSAPGVQVHIDKQTGKKTAPDDSALAELAAQSEEGLEAVSATTGIAAETQPPQVNADGSMSAKLGLEHMKFLVLTVGEDGERTMTHESPDGYADGTVTSAADKGDK